MWISFCCILSLREAGWWGIRGGQERMLVRSQVFCFPGPVRDMCSSPDGRWIALGFSSGLVSVLDVRGGLLRSQRRAHTGEILQVKCWMEEEGWDLFVSALFVFVCVWIFAVLRELQTKVRISSIVQATLWGSKTREPRSSKHFQIKASPHEAPKIGLCVCVCVLSRVRYQIWPIRDDTRIWHHWNDFLWNLCLGLPLPLLCPVR